MAIASAERRVNVGVFISAALLLDVVLWFFVLLGWESVTIPANFASTHQPEFSFPYSHSLLASVLWSAAAGAAAFSWYSRLRAAEWRASVLIVAAVFSHWHLDVLVHQPELPLAGATSARVGLGLWHRMPVALVVEAAICVVGLSLFVPGRGLSRAKAIALTVLNLVILAFTVAGMTIAPPPSSPLTMAVGSLVTLAAVCALASWLGKLPHEGQA